MKRALLHVLHANNISPRRHGIASKLTKIPNDAYQPTRQHRYNTILDLGEITKHVRLVKRARIKEINI